MKLMNNIFLKRNRHLTLFMLAFAFLLMSSLTHFQFMVQGRQIFPRKYEENIEVKMRLLVGSRPPRCEQRCKSCGHCEAIQVPITPTIKFMHQQIVKNYGTPRNIAYSRGDDISNYKPMCWKCKCGDFFFNP